MADIDPANPSPLAGVDPDALTRAFEADPLTLSPADLEPLVLDLRRRRTAFLAEEALAASKTRQPRTPPAPTTPAIQAVKKSLADLKWDDLAEDGSK